MIIEQNRQYEYIAYVSRKQALQLIATLSKMLMEEDFGSRHITVSRVLRYVHPYVNIVIIPDSEYDNMLR